MGDRLRRLSRQFLKILFQAALPGIIIYGMLLGSFVLRGTPHDVEFSPLIYLRLLLVCYATALVAATILEFYNLRGAILRTDGMLIGNHFGSFSKRDRLFCDALEFYAKDSYRSALDLLLQVQEYPMNAEEEGVLSFYIGRCYQGLSCPSNAIGYYEKARENGFSRPYSMLFAARSHAECGNFNAAYQLFTDLLEHDPPKDFYFLYTDIGYLFIRQKKPDEAAKWFERSIAERQNFAFALSGMAIVSLQRGEFKAANDYHYKALVNHLKDPSSFRRYFEETKRLMLNEHPEWDAKQAAAPETSESPV